MSAAPADPLHPQVRALIDSVENEARLADGPSGLDELRAEYTAVAERYGGTRQPVAEVVDVYASGVPVRVYAPDPQPLPAPAGTVVYAHGGGWIFGDLDGIDRVCRSLALASGHVVCSVDYRLAPEHPFPAAVEDVVSVLEWVASDHPDSRFGQQPDLIAVAGDSAGANLAAVAALRRREFVRAQMLIYPALDATLSGESYAQFDEGYSLSRADMASAFKSYLHGADPESADVSPLLSGVLAGAPPAFIAVASHDVLRDDGVRYSQALRAAGVDAELEVVDGMVHGFVRWGGAVAAANAVIQAGGSFLADRLSAER